MSANQAAIIAIAKPTSVRWRIVSLLFVIIVITFLDRMNLSIAARYIQLEFSLDNLQLGYILSGFVAGYALFQIPGGLLADWWGPRATLAIAVSWWSLFTALTAAAPLLAGYLPLGLIGSFFVVRFMVGLGEAAIIPNCNKTVALWMAPGERGFGNSLFLSGIGVGGALSFLLVVWLISGLGWRWSFVVWGILGVPVAASWWWNRPEQHRGVNPAELLAIGGGAVAPRAGRAIRWELFRSRSLWALILSYGFQGYVIYVFYAWFYLYVVTVRHFPVRSAAYWAAVPFIAVAILTPIGGRVSGRAVRKLRRTWGAECWVA